MLIKIIAPVVAGLLWMWRGWTYPKCIHGYLRGLVTSFGIVGIYCLTTSNLTVFSGYGLYAILVLTLSEGIYGYGETTENIDDYHQHVKPIKFPFPKEVREEFTYLGCISMCYILFPFLFLHPEKSALALVVLAILAQRVYPFAKLVQLTVFNKLEYYIYKLIKKEIKIDTWKLVEFSIGSAIVGLWISAGLFNF